MKKLSAHQQRELEQLGQRMLFSISFAADVENFTSAGELKRIVESAIASGDLRAARLLNREVSDLMLGLAPRDRECLNKLLRDKLGVDTAEDDARLRQDVLRAIARGRIASEKERRRLEEYADRLAIDGGADSTLSDIRRLLAHRG